MNFQPKLKEVEMKNMVKNICAAMVISLCAAGHLSATENNPNNDNKFMEENLNLIQEWDKTFPQSDKVNHKKITFHNRYGITLAADLYVPKNVTGKLPAIAISGPFGAVKEQASGLYAQTLAERGFLTIAFDPSYTGESSGQPRYVASPDINTEDFSAAVDYLSTRDDVDAERIGILGICGWGGMALNAAAIDTRIKATVTVTMYDMSRVNANGYFDSMNADARHELRQVVVDVEIAQLKVITVYQPLGTVTEVIVVVECGQTRNIGNIPGFFRPVDFIVQIPVGYIGVIAQWPIYTAYIHHSAVVGHSLK
jgi:hypothetical protein